MIRVYTGQVLALVEHMKTVLKMYNIESEIRNRYLSAAIGELPPHEAWPQLWVTDEDFESAQKIIDAAERKSPESKEIFICTKCGEQIEGQFFECWNCGTTINGDDR